MSLKTVVSSSILTVFFLFSNLLLTQDVLAEDILNSWNSTSNVPISVASQTSLGYGSKVYTFGGANYDDFANVYTTSIDNNGHITSWIPTTQLPYTRYWHSLVNRDEDVYLVGGASYDGSTHYNNTVFLGKIGEDGGIDSWQALEPLPVNIAQASSAVVGDWLYIIGGLNSSGTKQTVYYAHINNDGTIGSWFASSSSLPNPTFASGKAVYGNHIYIIGGVVNGVVTKKVYRATVNTTNGALSPWEEMEQLPHEYNSLNQAIIAGNKIIVVGGGII
jgi:hypothetical protein